MKSYSRDHLGDASLMSVATSRLSQGRGVEADHLADIAAIDKRRLYLPAYRSMFAFCMKEWNLCEQAAYFRIRAARTARRFPVIFEALASGRLHVSAVVLLRPHLTAANVEELMAAAMRKSKREIKQLLAERFPQPDLPTRVRALPTRSAPVSLAVELSAGIAPATVASSPTPLTDALFPGIVAPQTFAIEQPALAQTVIPVRRATVVPLAPKRYGLQLTMSQEMHDDLRQAQDLLSHQIPSGDEAQVIHRALRALIQQLERTKFALTNKPRKPRPGKNPRHIPAQVKRAVEIRDGRRCTFVSETGQRCHARRFLEFDHVQEVARGGQSTVENVRLLCRAHNQFSAERTYGVEFMRGKRGEGRGPDL